METLGAVVGSLGFMAILVGAIMFLPIAFLKRRRRAARITLICGALGFIFGLIAAPGAKQATSESKQAASTAPAAEATSKVVKAPAKVSEQEIRELWGSLASITGACDKAAVGTAKALQSGDVYVVYPAAKNAAKVCSDSSNAARELRPPASSTGEVRTAFEEAIKRCSDGDVVRSGAFAKVAEIADGNGKPSAVMDAKADLETGSQAGLYCATGMIAAVGKAGYDASFFKSAKK